MRLALCVFLLTALPAMAASQQQFDRWTAACRDDGYCAATAFQDPQAGGSPSDYVLRIGRHAEETYWELSLTTIAKVADSAEAFTIEVDGEPQDFTGAANVAAYGSGTDFFFMGAGVQTVMDRLMPGRAVSIDFTDRDGAGQRPNFSLQGLTEALIWIDTQQGRLGSERVAETPPVGLAPIDPQGILEGGIPPDVMARRDADSQCRPLDELANGGDIEIDPDLGEGKKLYLLPCWDAAYNFGWRGYVEVFAGEYETVALPEVSPSGAWSASIHLINYAYDPAAKELSTFYKGRGSGDCGSSGTYRWDSHQFVLVEYRARECDTAAGGENWDFPVLYPAPN